MEYKFLNTLDKELFEWEVKNADGDEEKFVHRHKGLVSQLKDFRKSQNQKQQWHKNRWQMLRGMKRFHKSTQGKKFHRMLGRFLASRYLRDKSMIRDKADNNYREYYDLGLALSSLHTHAILETQYYIPSITESVEYEEFIDYLTEQLGQIYSSLNDDSFIFENYEELLLRLTEGVALIKAFAEKTGKPEAEVEKAWNDAKSAAKRQKDEDDDGFWAYTTSIFKKMMGIKG
jgi:hypothetical protein